MSTYQTIKFKATRSTSKLNADKVCYQGQIIHNLTLNARETREAFADYANLTLPMGNLAIDSIAAFIAREIAKGHRLDFGGFAVGLKMRGGLPAANSPYDPKSNSLSIEITPGSEVKRAVRYLKPVNVSDVANSSMYTTFQRTPYETYDTFAATGTRTLQACGHNLLVNPSGEGEGVWIEDDVGQKLLTGRILPGGDCTTCNFKLTGDITPGLYWLVICSRRDPTGPLLRCHRRITAK